MSFENIIFEQDNSIAKITFNRPKALNALNPALLNEFSTALDQIAEDDKIKVLILTGSGDKAFVAGADISHITTLNPLQAKRFAREGQLVFKKIEELPIPVIAAVNGFALGGGTEVSLSCDFICASENAKFGLPEITLGIIPGFGGTQRLPRLIGRNRAKELTYTGKMISAKDAETYGMVNKVCAHDSLMDDVMKTAKSIAAKGSVSLRAAKSSINNGMSVELDLGCQIEADAFALCIASEDGKEGTTAFLEKRKAEFKGTFES